MTENQEHQPESERTEPSIAQPTNAGTDLTEIDDPLSQCEAVILTPEERKVLIETALEHKTTGNTHFKNKDYASALSSYQEALAVCPEDSSAERAVFYANIAACYIHMEDYKKAVENCSEALKCTPNYSKALLRRASANSRIGSWSSLTDSLADYKKILELEPGNKEALAATRTLPGRIEVQQEKEKNEMMGKLKDLGNSFLGNFGLSLDSFQMNQDPKSGGYSINMKK
ncbi:hypothetical protein PhCBS80983_g04746 [Powellomyces hirtus]|uniref:Uncharacterized protein n=1 Tax=Powellomyces hirtus TaxID=109895 RepID=A0A507DYX0_9FUNG|nr:hypothetical protein PhCBS80983_g04746 [Powellomyces hirtus]